MIDNMTQAMQMFTHHNQAGIEKVKKWDPRSRVQDLIQLEEASTQFTTQLGEQLQLLKSSLHRDVSFEVVRNMHLISDTAYVAGQCQSFFQVAATHLAWPQQSAFAIVAEGMRSVNPQVPPFVPHPGATTTHPEPGDHRSLPRDPKRPGQASGLVPTPPRPSNNASPTGGHRHLKGPRLLQ